MSLNVHGDERWPRKWRQVRMSAVSTHSALCAYNYLPTILSGNGALLQTAKNILEWINYDV